MPSIWLLPLTVTVTRPPPALPSTRMSAISYCIFSILACNSFTLPIMPMMSRIVIGPSFAYRQRNW
jgi:hypothetical protein